MLWSIVILPFLRGAGNGSQFCSLHSQARRGVSPVFYVGVDHVCLLTSAEARKEETCGDQRRVNMFRPSWEPSLAILDCFLYWATTTTTSQHSQLSHTGLASMLCVLSVFSLCVIVRWSGVSYSSRGVGTVRVSGGALAVALHSTVCRGWTAQPARSQYGLTADC